MKRKVNAKHSGFRLFPVIALLGFYACAAQADGNIQAGKDKSATCQGCHGTDGNSFSPEWPHLASQHVGYLTKQIRNFRDGERKNDTMSAMAAGLSDQDINDIASYFASQTLKAEKLEIDSEIIKTGRKIYKGGNPYTGIPACAGCHGPRGDGNKPAAFPHIAGQRQTYLIKTLNEFRSGARNNDINEIMRNIAARMTDSEISAVSAYITSLATSQPVSTGATATEAPETTSSETKSPETKSPETKSPETKVSGQ